MHQSGFLNGFGSYFVPDIFSEDFVFSPTLVLSHLFHLVFSAKEKFVFSVMIAFYGFLEVH